MNIFLSFIIDKLFLSVAVGQNVYALNSAYNPWMRGKVC